MPPITKPKSRYAPFTDCPPLLREYLSYILTIRGLSPRTVDGYYIELRTFLRYLKQAAAPLDDAAFSKLPIIDVSTDQICKVQLSDIYSFLNFALERGNSAYSRARKVSALSSFYKYLNTKTLYLQDNPIKNLDRPQLKRSLPKFLTLHESTQLLETADAPQNARGYCMLTLFLNCGMRLSELVGLNRQDIRDDRTLLLLGKGNKERIIYLNDACLTAIAAYLEESKEVSRKEDALFVSERTGKRLSPRRVEQLIGDELRHAGLSGKGYTPHKLRHTAATLLYQHGHVDVRVLQEILGHSSLSTTQIYTHVSGEQLEQAADASPLAGLQPKTAGTSEDDSQNPSSCPPPATPLR